MDEIIALTNLLRSGEDNFWKLLRHFLNEKNIDYHSSYLVSSTEEGPNVEFGIVVTIDKKVYLYSLQLSNNATEVREVLEWENISDSYKSSPYDKEVEVGFSLVDKS